MLADPIAVTGGSGFIGSNLVNRLRELGHDPLVLDLPDHDLRGGFGFARTMDMLRTAATVFHLAADFGGVAVFHGPRDFEASTTNTQIDINVLRVVAETGARTFVASSACAYPTERQMTQGCAPRLSEDDVGRGTPDALYGAAKLHLLRMADKLPNVRVGILHTVYGPHCEREGRRMKFPAAVATKAIRARDTNVLELWGNGAQLRSYLYVDDAVDRILRLTDDEAYYGPMNVGYEGAESCMEIAALCLVLAGAPGAVLHLNLAEPSGVLARDCDNTRWRELYGPTNDVPPEVGFRRLIEWLDS